ncbi:hypothetical protein ACQEVI_06055 [Promicromonospora sp. CA-289599]|uniref:hypothetical protein n=1 Tax=Promicromonospora sp. CA-289599 TaxID=3240014 RepID=UPI003D8CF0A5
MTSDRFDLSAEVAEAAVDRSSAWRFVTRFAEYWLGEPLTASSGVSAEQIETREADLGVQLPPAVREFYGLVGRRHDLFSNQDVLLSIVQRQMYIDDGALIVRHENQGVCRWGILLEHLDQEDPPVVVLADLADKSQEQWEPWTETFSAAVVQWLVYESCMRPGVGDLATKFDRSADLAVVTGSGRPLAIAPFPVGHLSVQIEVRWSLTDEVIVLADDTAFLISARTQEAADAFRIVTQQTGSTNRGAAASSVFGQVTGAARVRARPVYEDIETEAKDDHSFAIMPDQHDLTKTAVGSLGARVLVQPSLRPPQFYRGDVPRPTSTPVPGRLESTARREVVRQ